MIKFAISFIYLFNAICNNDHVARVPKDFGFLFPFKYTRSPIVDVFQSNVIMMWGKWMSMKRLI